MKEYYLYITTNPARTVLYIEVTNDLLRRITEHRENKNDKRKFTRRYFCYNRVYYEEYNDIWQAIEREKKIKKWRREKKERLINSFNPQWEGIQAPY